MNAVSSTAEIIIVYILRNVKQKIDFYKKSGVRAPGSGDKTALFFLSYVATMTEDTVFHEFTVRKAYRDSHDF